MQIEHTTHRKGGSHHSIGATEYHFTPNDKGAHIAKVENKDHVKRFLSIDSFCVYDGGKPTKPVAPVIKAAAPAAPKEPDTPSIDVAPRDTLDTDTTVTPLEDMDRDELVAIHQQSFGKKPHYKWDESKIIAAIRAASD